eukprot:CAMPEP_0197833104 /NCGR_PEP_ID=MMETSP1437-20131217/17759_1 /TAXON_ID=49252 ORGANISM="Eucampia antarctica, Strain CCMP1452" /NCGR_SAMPLE_ID=MMETSP1437 /ASSEMBLY_ACC=CAM_ASM_001096 /LENGTH=392 /DNA_ID=CAMNT_0043436941 /DNA_START=87 /DNA_END=1265 /DNA_ORIENTATION=-
MPVQYRRLIVPTIIVALLAYVCDGFSMPSRKISTKQSALFAGRREAIGKLASISIVGGCNLLLSFPAKGNAAQQIIETDDSRNDLSFEGVTSKYASAAGKDATAAVVNQSQGDVSDEITITVPKADLLTSSGLGIELGEVEFRTARRVVVKSVAPDSVASKLGIQKDWVVVSVNGQSAERTNTEGVAILVSRAVRSKNDDKNDNIELRFRDPFVFRQKLQDLKDGSGGEVTTQIAPTGDTTQRNAKDGSVKLGYDVTEQTDQKLTVTQVIPPKYCTRGATTDDLLEISYLGTVLETGQVFDGSSVKINGETIPGRGGDVSLYFVLGKQPFGQFPPSWDVGLEGICVGERRRLTIPPVLAYGSKGLPRRKIPPDATLQYDITCLSINGLATPQ